MASIIRLFSRQKKSNEEKEKRNGKEPMDPANYPESSNTSAVTTPSSHSGNFLHHDPYGNGKADARTSPSPHRSRNVAGGSPAAPPKPLPPLKHQKPERTRKLIVHKAEVQDPIAAQYDTDDDEMATSFW